MDWEALRLSLLLAVATGLVLIPAGVMVARGLAYADFRGKSLVEAAIAIPLVLPPTVLGYYLLTAMGGASPLGAFYERMTGSPLAFSFQGLLVGSLIFNLPFALIPMERAFESIPVEVRQAAECCGLSRHRTMWRIELPLAWPGIVSALVMTIAHTVGEFGVVLMVGGNIPGRTRVISIAIYEQVETLNFAQAHLLAGGFLAFSFAVLVLVYGLNRRYPVHTA